MFTPIHEAPLAYLLVLATVLCSIRALSHRSFFESWCMHPFSVFRGRRVFTVFTSVLIHGESRHMVITVWLLAVGMPEVEYMLIDDFGPLQGSLLFFVAIVFTAVFAGMLSVFQYRHHELHWSSGGSALFYSIVMLYLVYFPVDPLSGLPVFLRSWPPICFAGMLFLVLIVLALLKDPAGSIHLYGALAGILLACMARPQSIREVANLLSPTDGLEKRNDEASGNNQATDYTDDDTIKEGIFPAFSTGDGFRLTGFQLIHPSGDG